MKKMSRKTKITLTALGASAILSSVIGLSTVLAAQKNTSLNSKSNTSDTQNNSSNENELDYISRSIKNSNYSKKLEPTLNIKNSPTSSVNKINYVNGAGQIILTLWADGDDVYAHSPNPIRIQNINNNPDISFEDYEISFTTYGTRSQTITGETYVDNKPLEVKRIPWVVKHETFLNPSVSGTNANSYIEFQGLENPVKVGSLKNGYVSAKISLAKTSRYQLENNKQENYYGPNVMKIREGEEYSNFFGKSTNDKMLDDEIVFTNQGSKPSIIYNYYGLKTGNYSISNGWGPSSTKYLPSEFLKNNLITVPFNVSNVFNQVSKNELIKPEVYGFANDNDGTISIVYSLPYIVVNQGNKFSVQKSELKRVILKGFRKQGDITESNQKIVNSNEINFINKTGATEENNMLSTKKNKDENALLATDSALSPLSLFDFSIKNNSLKIAPKDKVLKADPIINNFYKNNGLVNWDSLINGANAPFTLTQNAKSLNLKSTSEFSSQLNNFVYDSPNSQALLLSSINLSSISETPISNIFSIYNSDFNGPWVAQPSNISSSASQKYGFINYLAYLLKTNQFDQNNDKFSKLIPLSFSSQENFLNLKTIFGSALPTLSGNLDTQSYLNNLNSINYSSGNNNTTVNASILKYGDQDTSFISYKNGPVIINNNNEPYYFEPTNIFAWNDSLNGNVISFENVSIFSSQENFEYNMNLGFKNDNFGRTSFLLGDESEINKTLLPSEFIKDDKNLSKIKIEAFNSPLVNNDNSTISFEANDENGELYVTVKPMVEVSLSDDFKLLNVNSFESFKNLSPNKLATLFNTVSSNETQEHSFVISGFKKTGTGSDIINDDMFLHAKEVYAKSFLEGPDFEFNYNKLSGKDKVNFEKWFIANAIDNLEINELNWADPQLHDGNSSVYVKKFNRDDSPEGLGVEYWHDLDLELFDRVIASYERVDTNIYNEYSYNITFKPHTLQDFNGNWNVEPQVIKLVIDTSKGYNSWIANDYISTGIYDAYKNDPSLINPFNSQSNNISRNDFIKLFSNTIIENKGEFSYARYFQNGYLNSLSYENNSIISQPGNLPSGVVGNQKYIVKKYNFPNSQDQFDMKFAKTVPLIYGYNKHVGMEIDTTSKIGKVNRVNATNSIADIGSWDFDTNNQINDGQVTLQYQPKIWLNDGEYTTENISKKSITFGDILNSSVLKNTSLIKFNFESFETGKTPKSLYDDLKGQSGSYSSFVENVANICISNLVRDESNKLKTEVILKPSKVYDDQSSADWITAKENGILVVDVFVKGEYYKDGEIKNSSSEISLGSVTITGLKKSKYTKIVDHYTIPNIDSYDSEEKPLESNLSEYVWLKTVDLAKTKPEVSFEDMYENKELTYSIISNIIQNPVINGSTINTQLTWKTNTASSNQFFNNEKGSITLSNLSINNYYDDDKVVNSKKPIEGQITIDGFKKVIGDKTDLVAPNNNELYVPEFIGKNISTITEQEIRNALLSYSVVKNFPLNAKLSKDLKVTEDMISVKILGTDAIHGEILVECKLTAATTDYFKDGIQSKNAIIIDGKKPEFFMNPTGYKYPSLILKIVGLNNISGETIVDKDKIGIDGTNTFNSIIATVGAEQISGFQLNREYGWSDVNSNSSIVRKIINLIQTSSIIVNLPPDFNFKKNIKIKITKINNTTGIIDFKVCLNKYYKLDADKKTIIEYNGPNFEEVGDGTFVSGFKQISGLTSDGASSSLNCYNPLGKEGFEYSEPELKDIVVSNFNEIFKHAPKLSSFVSSDLNKPTITKDQIGVTIKNQYDSNTDSVVVTITLDSYYGNSDKYSTPVWINDKSNKFSHDLKITGFKDNINTVFEKEISVDYTDSSLLTVLPDIIAQNWDSNFTVALKQAVFKHGVRGNKKDLHWSDLGIDNNSLKANNIEGSVTLTVIANKYYKDGELTTQPYSWSVKIKGLLSVVPTVVEETYNGIDDAAINTIYAYQYTKNDAVKLISRSLVFNKPPTFTDQNVLVSSLFFDNQKGEAYVDFRINSYYNDQGLLINSSSRKYQLKITGFKKVSSVTQIKESYTIKDDSNNKWSQRMAISLLDYQTGTNLKPTVLMQNIVEKYMIVNAPSGANVSITNIQVNNITGVITATVSLDSHFDSRYNLVGSPLTKQIEINGFAPTNGPTTISQELNSIWTNVGAVKFLKDQKNSGYKDLKDFVFKNIQNKWKVNSGQKVNELTIDDIVIANFTAKNTKGEINLDVGIKKYVDSDGVYHRTNVGEEPLIINITIKGFQIVNSSEIKDESYLMFDVNNEYAHDYLTKNESKFKSFMKKIIFDNYLINKAPATKEGDLSIDIKEVNNNQGTILITVIWNNNFYDYEGNLITSAPSSQETKPTGDILVTGFKPLTAPTTVVKTIDVNKPDIKASQYGIKDKSGNDNLKDIKEIILKNLINLPFTSPQIGVGDIQVETKKMSDGKDYYGVVNDIKGILTIDFTLSKYYNNDFEFIDTTQNTEYTPLKLTTTFSGFKLSENKPTTVEPVLDLNNPKYSDVETVKYAKTFTSKNYPIDQLDDLVISTNIIKNWPGNNDKSKMRITRNSANSDGTMSISISLQNYTNVNDGLVNSNKWSQPYNVTIKGFKVYEPTVISDTVALTGKSLNLSNYPEGEDYSKINVFNINDKDDISKIIWQQLKENIVFVENKTATLEALAQNYVFNSAQFDKCIKIATKDGKPDIIRNAINGTIIVGIELYSYYDYNDNGAVIEKTADATNPPSGFVPLKKTVTFSGFGLGISTEVYKNVDVSALNIDELPSRLSEVPRILKNIIINNKELFMNNLPLDANLENSLDVQVINFSNVDGTIYFNLILNHFYDEYGQEIENTNKSLTTSVLLSGLKTIKPTDFNSVIKQNGLNIVEDLGFKEVDLTVAYSDSFESTLKDNIISYQNRNASNNEKAIWLNLPSEDNTITAGDFSIEIDYDSLNFTDGTLRIHVNTKKFINQNGIKIEYPTPDSSLNTDLLITGFKTVSGPTKIKDNVVQNGFDISENFLLNDIDITEENSKLAQSIKSNLNNAFFSEIFSNLPNNFDIKKDLIDVEITEKVLEDGVVFVNITIKNYFDYSNGKIKLFEANKKFENIKLTGFNSYGPTELKSNQLRVNEQLKKIGLKQILSNQDRINDFLSLQETKKKILKNAVVDQSSEIIKTEIILETFDAKSIDGPNGSIDISVRFKNYYYKSSTGIISIDEGVSTPRKLKLVGFNEVKETICVSKGFSINNTDITQSASSYVNNVSSGQSVLDLLNSHKKELFGVVNDEELGELEILSFSSPNDENSKVYVDDVNGLMKLKFSYKGGYDKHAQVGDPEIKTSDVITITGFNKEKLVAWDPNADIVEKNGYTELIIDTRSENFETEVDQWNETNQYNPSNLIVNYLENGANVSVTKVGDWERDAKNGTISVLARISGWTVIAKNDSNNPFDLLTSDSILVDKETKKVKIVLTGFLKVDLEKTTTLLTISLCLAGGLILSIILILILWFVYRRRFM